eukprot:350981-Chlamydomonas_euryale.AAC.2
MDCFMGCCLDLVPQGQRKGDVPLLSFSGSVQTPAHRGQCCRMGSGPSKGSSPFKGSGSFKGSGPSKGSGQDGIYPQLWFHP